MAASKQHRIDVRIDGKTVFSQDVDKYRLKFADGQLSLTTGAAGDTPVLVMPDNPLIPPPPSPGAPDGEDEDTGDSNGPQISQAVHDGTRDKAAEAAAAEARREARRQAAAQKKDDSQPPAAEDAPAADATEQGDPE